MFKSVLRMMKFPLLKGSMSADGRVTTLFNLNAITSKNICTTALCSKEIRLENNEKVKVGRSSKYGLVEGEIAVETLNINQQDLFPDADTPNRLFNGIPFKDLHIVNIKSTPNNTILSFTDGKGLVIMTHTAGIEGFKNAKKGTNIAGQQAAITLANRILEYGVNLVRIRVQGIGAGRMSSIKAFHMAGLNIVSITDATRVSWCPPRPRKVRRI